MAPPGANAERPLLGSSGTINELSTEHVSHGCTQLLQNQCPQGWTIQMLGCRYGCLALTGHPIIPPKPGTIDSLPRVDKKPVEHYGRKVFYSISQAIHGLGLGPRSS